MQFHHLLIHQQVKKSSFLNDRKKRTYKKNFLSDEELKERISATVGLIVRRRLIPEMFEAYIQSKGIQDERLDFLFGGEGHDYYQWKLFCLRCNHPGFLLSFFFILLAFSFY